MAEVQHQPQINGLHHQVPVRHRGTFRRLLAFVGPAYLVSVGYMDPGNWATDIAGGSQFGYTLIWVLLMSNLMAVMLQTLAARLGIVTGFDLAQGCRREYPRIIGIVLWILAELAIAATDLAEALGTILGLNLLFGLPLLWGCFVTAFDTVLLLLLLRLGVRKMEAFIVLLVATIGVCFIIEIFLAQPSWGGIAAGFVPKLPEGALYVAIGIIGATVMPHNLYLHSSLVQSRQISNTITGKTEACRFNFLDSVVALNAAFFVNAAILIMAAAVFYERGIQVTEIQQAHELLKPILGNTLAPIMFAVALLAAGQSSTITGTISGQIVMEGFLNIRVRPWLRRLITRGLALAPAVIVIALYGDQGTYKLLIFSQVLLSLQLPFAVIPLISFTSDRRKMGGFANPLWLKIAAGIVAALILTLNIKLVMSEVSAWTQHGAWVWLVILPPLLAVGGVLVYLIVRALLQRGKLWGKELVGESSAVAERIKPHPVKHIGVALERTPGDAEVISAAITLARAWSADLTLIHIVDTPGTLVYGQASGSQHASDDEAYLEHLVREVEERDLPVEMMLRHGRPSDEIVKAVHEGGFDLLVLGSHGHKHFADWVFGQTVDKVRHGIQIPVYVVRSGYL